MTITKSRNRKSRHPWSQKSTLATVKIGSQQGDFDPSLMAGLMLTMQLRESLGEQDRSLLANLAPPDRSVFLVHRGRFVHPEQGNPFPLEHIGSCAGGSALFSHRFRPGSEPGGQANTIQTAVLNPEDPDPLLFGWYGPEGTSPDNSLDHRFSQLVADLRRAYSESVDLAHRLKAQLKTEEPTMIVDRRTGRLLWLNNTAAKLCGQERSALVDTRFEHVRTALSQTLTNNRLVMNRISAGDIQVTIVTLAEIQRPTHPANRFLADFLVHPAKRNLAGIIMAADLLKSSLADFGNGENAELVDIIASEARALDDLMGKQMILLSDVAEDASFSSLVAQTELAIDRIDRSRKRSREVTIHDFTGGRHLSAPSETFAALVEAILRSHDTDPDKYPVTQITFEPDRKSDDILIRFETEASDTFDMVDSDLWLEYARRLAPRLGFEWFSHKRVGDGLICTKMISNPYKILETQ